MTILIVDDDPMSRKLLARMLEGLDATILFADSIVSAIFQMGTIPPPDLILLDLRMPPNNEFDALEAVGAFRQFNPNLIVIPVTGMMKEEVIEAIAKVNANVCDPLFKGSEEFCQRNLLRVVEPLIAQSTGVKDSALILEKIHAILNESAVNKE